MVEKKRIVKKNQRDICRAEDCATTAVWLYEKALEVLRPIGYFVDDVVEEIAIPGGAENLRKFQKGQISHSQYVANVNADLATDATASLLGSFIGGSTGGFAGAVAGGPAGAALGANAGSIKGAIAGYVASRATKAVARAILNFRGSGSGRNKVEKVSSEERIRCTPEEQLSFIKDKLKKGNWVDDGHKINKKKSYYDPETGLRYVPVKKEKNDIEVWKVTGKKAKHQGAIECKKGTLYEGPKHPDGVYE